MYSKRLATNSLLLSSQSTWGLSRANIHNKPLAFGNMALNNSFFNYNNKSIVTQKHVNRYIGSTYEVSFRCPEEERQRFQISRCLIPISVGQKIHEGEKLKDTLGVISKNFSSCVLMLDDSIQAGTLMLNENMKEPTGEYQWQSITSSVIRAIAEGDAWLKRNRDIIESQLTIPMRLVRWYEWRSDIDFKKAIRETREFYNSCQPFKQAISENIKEFLDRYEKNHQSNSNYVRTQAEWFCREYLLEECAVMMHLWPKLGCEYEVYPSGRNAAMQAAFDLNIKQRFPHLLKPVSLRFHKLQPKNNDNNDKTKSTGEETPEINEQKPTIKI